LIRYSKEEINVAIRITDLANKFSIALESVNSGNFTHKCKCPSKEHKSGSERTGSLYIDEVNNNFYCFGCGASNNVIDFYILCKDVDFSTTIVELSEVVDPTKISKVSREQKVVNFSQLLEISNIFRKAQAMHSEDIEWIEKLMKKTDQYLEGIDRHNVQGAKKILEKIKVVIRRRYSNRCE
jgi:DNA primase